MAKKTKETMDIYELAEAVNLLGNSSRLSMLAKLRADGETGVGNLAEHAKISLSAVSQHLAKLKAGGLVTTRRDAQARPYTANEDALVEIVNELMSVLNLDLT